MPPAISPTVIKSAALQQARGDGRPVAARTIDQQGAVLRQLFQIFRQMIERDAQTSRDVLLIALARRANVNRQRRLSSMTEVPRRTGALRRSVEATSSGREFEAVQSILQISGHVIESDAPEADCGFVLLARVRDNYDRMLPVEHGSGPRCVLPDEADIDAARQMRRGKFGRIARIENLRARLPAIRARASSVSGFISRASA